MLGEGVWQKEGGGLLLGFYIFEAIQSSWWVYSEVLEGCYDDSQHLRGVANIYIFGWIDGAIVGHGEGFYIQYPTWCPQGCI